MVRGPAQLEVELRNRRDRQDKVIAVLPGLHQHGSTRSESRPRPVPILFRVRKSRLDEGLDGIGSVLVSLDRGGGGEGRR